MASKTVDRPKRMSLDDFEIGKPLGSGKFGHVYLARTKKEHFIVALKILYKQQLIRDGMCHQFRREIENHSRLDHPNIIRMYHWFWDEHRIVIVMEYAPRGELFAHFRKCGRFEDNIAAKYIKQMISAVNHCHSKKVIHRDIKPENILIGFHHELKIADFGWSVHASKTPRNTLCGTPDYLPPEILARQKYDHRADIWCLGVLAYELLVGKAPFESKDTEEAFEKIRKVQYTIPDFVSPLARDFIQKLLIRNPTERMSLIEAINHEWITSNNE